MVKPAEMSAKIDKPNVFLRLLDKTSYWASVWFERIAMISIVGNIVSVVIDVAGDKIFNQPMSAGTEIVYFLQIIAIAGALAMTKLDGKHIRLEFVDSLPHRIKNVFAFLCAVLGLAIFILLAWKSFDYAMALRSANEVTAASRFPLFPFAIWIGISCIPLCLVLFKEMVNSLVEVVKR
jgi:TRAP-type C4-dicarboxylate transport system permease small subunit